MARSLEQQSRFREAVEEYESLIQEEEDQENLARILARIGFCHMRDGKLHQSRRAFERALQIKKDYKAIYGNLGALSLELGDLEQARFYLLEGLTLGEDPELLIQLGVCQLRLSDAIRAEISLKRAMGIADEEQVVRVHYLLGKAYLAQGRYELSRACFFRIISDSQVDVDCLLLYLEASEHTKYLEEDLQNLVYNAGNEMASLHACVLYLLSRHRQQEALIYAQLGTDKYPQDPHLWFYKASTLAVLNQFEEALSALAMAVELEPAMASRARSNPCFAGLRKSEQFMDLITVSGRGW
jgi:tetratricopeptide (TPR) repeat protein